MFTGIIEEVAKIKSIKKGIKSAQIQIEAKKILTDLNLGDSVATNGVCLTVSNIDGNTFSADIMNETLQRTNLKELNQGSFVNLERAMLLNSRFGGHIVSGHIDGTGKIISITKDDIAYIYKIQTSENITKYIIEKGSITIDGISLTVIKVDKQFFSVSIIPHTLENTILAQKKIGSTINLENDIVAKYIEKFTKKESITKEFLIKHGY